MRRGPREPDRFDAFISYGHAADGRLAPQLQKGLEGLAKPWFARRVLRVFRDDTGLSVNPDLWGSIAAAMDASEWFVLLLSPQAAASPWVGKEIEHWLAHRSADRILLVQTDGDLRWDPARGDYDAARSTCLPPALRGRFDAEPRHLDLRWAHDVDQLDLRHARFRDAVADLAAPIHGVPKDEIEGEDVRQHRRHVVARRVAFGTLAVLLGLAVAASVVAFEQRDRAERQTDIATSQRLAVQAADVAPRQLDLGLLLAVAGRRLDASPQPAAGLLDTLSQSPALTRFEHAFGRDVLAMALSPDRTTLAIISGEGSLATYDATTRRRIAGPVETDVTSPLEIVFSPDGGRIAIGGDGVALVDAATLRPVASTPTPAWASEWITFSADGARLAMSGTDGLLRVARVPDLSPAIAPRRVSRAGRTTAIAFTPDGDGLLVGRREGDVLVLDGATGRPTGVALPVVDDGAAYAVAYSPDGRILVTSGDGGRLLRWDARTLTRTGPALRFHRSYPYAVAFSPDGELFATSDDAGEIAVWETRTGRRINRFRAQGELVFDLAFTGDRELVSAATSGLVRWDVDAVPVGTRLGADGERLVAMAVAPDESAVAAVDHAGGVVVRGPEGKTRWAVTSGVEEAYAAAWSPTGDRIAVAGRTRLRGGVVTVLDADDGAALRTLGVNATQVRAVAWSPDGRSLVTGGRRGEVVLLDPSAPRAVVAAVRSTGRAMVTSVAFAPDGDRLAYGTGPGELVVTTAAGLRRVWTARGGSNVNTVAWTPDGRSVLSGEGLGLLTTRSAADGAVIGEPRAADVGEVASGVVTPDGTRAAAAGFTGSVAVTDVASGALLLAIPGHRGRATGAALVDGGRTLLSVGDDGALLRQTIDPDEWERAACAKAGRSLTDEESRDFGVEDGSLCP